MGACRQSDGAGLMQVPAPFAIRQGRRYEIFVGGQIHGHLNPDPPTPTNLICPPISATVFGKCWKMRNFNTCPEKTY